MNLIKNIMILITVFASVILAACGFHLRGNIPLPKTLSPMYIATSMPYDPLIQTIKDSLGAAHIEVTDSPKTANTILRIIDIQFSENLISVAASTNVRQYALAETLKMELTDSQGKVIIPVSALTATNPLTVESDEVLSASSQKETLVEEIRQALVLQLFAKLGSQNTKAALHGMNVNNNENKSTE